MRNGLPCRLKRKIRQDEIKTKIRCSFAKHRINFSLRGKSDLHHSLKLLFLTDLVGREKFLHRETYPAEKLAGVILG